MPRYTLNPTYIDITITISVMIRGEGGPFVDEETMRWFILAVALLLDPAAVLLLLAAASARREVNQ
jgi:hypothetical protein